MKKRNGSNEKENKQPKKLEETKPGYGDKKLEGIDRPST